MQKYRADRVYEKTTNGAVAWCADWMGGPTVSLVRNCPVSWHAPGATVTAYVTGEPDTWFSIPAVCSYRGARVRGFLTRTKDDGGWMFHAERAD